MYLVIIPLNKNNLRSIFSHIVFQKSILIYTLNIIYACVYLFVCMCMCMCVTFVCVCVCVHECVGYNDAR